MDYSTEVFVMIIFIIGVPLFAGVIRAANLPGANLFILAYIFLMLSNIFTVVETSPCRLTPRTQRRRQAKRTSMILILRLCSLLAMIFFKLPLKEKQKRYLFFIMLSALLATACPTEAASQRQNWHHDPFFQISDAISDCPKPAGPFVTESERLANAHHRAERGTSCWLAGKCDRPSSYDYDQDIAKAFKEALSKDNSFKDSTLWVTVQGRVVFIEGCVREKSMSARLEHFASRLPYVDIAVAHVRYDPADKPPYTLFDSP